MHQLSNQANKSHQPKVLYYSHTSEISGAEISLLVLLKNLRGFTPVLAAPEGELLERALAEGIKGVAIKSYRARLTKNLVLVCKSLLGIWWAGQHLQKIIQVEQPNIIHVNSIRAGLIASVVKRPKQTKLIWHVRDNLHNGIIGRVIRYVALRRADHIIAISRAIADNFSRSPKLKEMTSVVYNAVDITQTFSSSIRAEVGTAQKTFVVAVVGQITPWKRQHDAIAAFASFHKFHPESELWIVGEAKFRAENLEYEEHLYRQVSELGIVGNVKFLGFRRDVMNVMHSIDVLLLTSDHEPFGRVIIEAMLAGKPVIGTNAGGVPEIVENGASGFLIEVGDAEGFVHYLRQLQTSCDICKRMGNAGIRIVKKKFEPAEMTKKVMKIYDTTM